MHDVFLIISLYSAVINVMTVPFSNQIGTIFGYVMILSFWLYPICYLWRFKRLSKNAWKICVSLFLSTVFSVVTIFTATPDNFFVSIISFMCFYLALGCPKKESDQNLFRYINTATFILAVWFAVCFFFDFQFLYKEVDEYGNMQFTLGLTNPNGAAVYVLFAALMLIINARTTKKRIEKALNYVLLACMGLLMIKVGSRTVLLCFILTVVFCFTRLYKKVGTKTNVLCVLIPFAVLFFQIILGAALGQYSLFGETLDTGRLAMIRRFFDDLGDHPWRILFGSVGQYPFKNLHNAPLTIFATLGMVGLVAVYVFWFRKLREISKCTNTNMQRLAMIGVLVMILDSAAESMTMVGYAPYGLFMLILVKISQGDIWLAPISRERALDERRQV